MKTHLVILLISVSCYAIKVQADGEIKFKLRKCCSQFEIFDVKTMSCVQNVYQNSDNTSLLPDIMLDKSNPKKQVTNYPYAIDHSLRITKWATITTWFTCLKQQR